MNDAMKVANARDLYINSRLADYTLRIANAHKMNSMCTVKRLEREKNDFMRKVGMKSK